MQIPIWLDLSLAIFFSFITWLRSSGNGDEGGDPGASQEYSLTGQLVQGDE